MHWMRGAAGTYTKGATTYRYI